MKGYILKGITLPDRNLSSDVLECMKIILL